MRFSLLLLLIALTGSLGAGCASTDPAGFQKQVHNWVPLGTPVGEARKIMESHDFECRMLDNPSLNASGDSTLSCRKRPGMLSSMGDWQAEFTIRDGAVVAYSYIDM